MDARIQKIRANGTAAEIEIFEGLPHGFGLGTGTVAAGWLANAVKFWQKLSCKPFEKDDSDAGDS